MPVTRAHMTSFPARAPVLERSVASIAAQVDRVYLALNEFETIPEWLAHYPNVEAHISTEDWKDVGKFVSKPAEDDWVFLCDDDMIYRPGFVDFMINMAENFDTAQNAFALQSHNYIENMGDTLERARSFYYRKPYPQSRYVDQVATNSVLAKGKNIAPLEVMRGSQKFVDVRYSRWCWENGIGLIRLARPINMMQPLKSGGPTIYRDFTSQTPAHVVREVKTYAGRSVHKAPFGPKLSVFEMLTPARTLRKYGTKK